MHYILKIHLIYNLLRMKKKFWKKTEKNGEGNINPYLRDIFIAIFSCAAIYALQKRLLKKLHLLVLIQC